MNPVNPALIFFLLFFLFSPRLSAQIEEDTVIRIAFGSCNYQDKPQPLWKDVIQSKPDLWIWLGDNIYGDTRDIKRLRAKYAIQMLNPDYRQLLEACPVTGIWDDHDYGGNDANKDFPRKKESQRAFLDFLGEPLDAVRRQREGIYTSLNYERNGRSVKIILLDTRYFMDHVKKRRWKFYPDPAADLLGVAQWKWLEEELTGSKAEVNIICSGIQVLNEQYHGEKWGNYPASRQRLFDLLVRSQAQGVVLLSGDRHFAELAAINLPGYPKPVYEVTSSGLTHFSKGRKLVKDRNKYRVGNEARQLNYGLIEINWTTYPMNVTVKILGINNTILLQSSVISEQSTISSDH